MNGIEPWMWGVVFVIFCITTILIPKIVKGFYEVKYGTKYSQYFANLYAAQAIYVTNNANQEVNKEVNNKKGEK